MVLLGYTVFVFTAESFNPLAIPAKHSLKDGNRRRYHLLGLLAGCLVALSCLAAWFASRGTFLEGLKVSFIAAAGLVLLLLIVDTVRNVFRKRRRRAKQVTHQSVEHHSASLYKNTPTEDPERLSNITQKTAYPDNENRKLDVQSQQEAIKLENHIELKQKHEDELGCMLREHKLEVLEKTKRIDTLESTLTEMQKNTDVLNERQVELGSVLAQRENELKSVRQELELKDVVHNDAIRDLTEAKGLPKGNVPGLDKIKLALASSERNSAELQSRLQQTALKERAGRLKMEASAKRAVIIARQAIARLNEHENKLPK